MHFANWLSSFAAACHSIRKTRSRRRRHAYPVIAVEQLEDRSLLTPTVTIYCAGITSGVSAISEWNPDNPGDRMVEVGFGVDELQATDLTVDYSLSGTATIGTDYTGLSASGTVVIPAGSYTVMFAFVHASADALVEGDETILFDMPSTSDYVGANRMLTIRDNLAPVAFNDSASVVHDRPLTIPIADLIANDTDAESHTLTVTLTPGSATHGTVYDIGGVISFLPDLGFMPTPTDIASFTYTVSDGAMTSNVATVTINVTNNAPVANADGLFSVLHNSPMAGSPVNSINISTTVLLGNDTDNDADPLKFVFDSVTNGGVSPNFNDNGTPLDSSDDYIESLDFTPAPRYAGPASIIYKAYDGIANSNTATVSIDVTNIEPVAGDDSFTGEIDLQIIDSVNTNDADVDGDPIAVTLDTNVAHGTLVLNSDGSFTYDPNPGFVGQDTFKYTVTDGIATSALATVTINIEFDCCCGEDEESGSSEEVTSSSTSSEVPPTSAAAVVTATATVTYITAPSAANMHAWGFEFGWSATFAPAATYQGKIAIQYVDATLIAIDRLGNTLHTATVKIVDINVLTAAATINDIPTFNGLKDVVEGWITDDPTCFRLRFSRTGDFRVVDPSIVQVKDVGATAFRAYNPATDAQGMVSRTVEVDGTVTLTGAVLVVGVAVPNTPAFREIKAYGDPLYRISWSDTVSTTALRSTYHHLNGNITWAKKEASSDPTDPNAGPIFPDNPGTLDKEFKKFSIVF